MHKSIYNLYIHICMQCYVIRGKENLLIPNCFYCVCTVCYSQSAGERVSGGGAVDGGGA